MRSSLAWAAAGFVACAALGACNAITGIGNLTESDCTEAACDAGAIDANAPDSVSPVDARPPDAHVDSGKDAGIGKPACPSSHGPAMVLAGPFCIDSTEVTEADYAAFLAADAGKGLEPSSLCASNTDYAPENGCTFDPTGHADFPVACVDWCDAYAYCAWAGKRLCGTVGDGGSLDYETDFRKSGAEWFAACSHDGTLAYPYGAAYDASVCNGANAHGGAALPTGSLATCVGGYTGLFDMSGNVYEWIDSCDTGIACTDGGGCCGTCCRRMGGASNSDPLHLSCASDLVATGQGIGQTNPFTGLRCCADPLP